MWGSSTTTLKTKICCQLERRFQYFRLEFGCKMEQIIFVIVTCLGWNAAVILLWAFSLFLYHSMMHYCLSGILERGEQQELSLQETCNIVFFSPIYLILQASHLNRTRRTAPSWIVKVSSWFQSSLITLQAAAHLLLGQTDNIIKSREEVAPCSQDRGWWRGRRSDLSAIISAAAYFPLISICW